MQHPPPPEPAQTTVLFEVPVEELPEHLPTADEIESSPKLANRPATSVTLVKKHFFVKYGCYVHPSEAQNMKFARQHLGNLVPRVFAVYQRHRLNEPTITYIIMEYFHGRRLDQAWNTLDEARRLEVVNVLRNALQIIRAIPPPDYFGGLGMTKLESELFWTREPDPPRHGPFKTEEELIRGIVLCFRGHATDVAELKEFYAQRADYYSRVLPQVLRGSGKPVFTHSDLQRRNIMIGSKGEVAIVDWAASGWYPTWWEYAVTTEGCGNWRDDWQRYIPKFLDEYPNQYSWFHTIRTDLWT
ncbi:kinase-like domain-containing protein [Xylaria bambusicola]|uniref:kinase-like domain-containing protein n=1 Tax=Xylaria bambusicola TaxID=326684 RepID=UPI0020082958|nr:kinase-like domain-containing protein [Xylaria bambusicola]KAI0506648.1 kinase-like domain-containing protein [Xylaria bambusicola]